MRRFLSYLEVYAVRFACDEIATTVMLIGCAFVVVDIGVLVLVWRRDRSSLCLANRYVRICSGLAPLAYLPNK